MELPAVRRTQPITLGQISSAAHVHLRQWLHGKQQQHRCLVVAESLPLKRQIL